MSTRSFSFVEGEFYHIYNRGVDKREIFLSNKDKELFLERMFIANGSKSINIRSIKNSNTNIFEWDRGEQQVAIGAFCLMPNHFHILLTPLVEEGVSTFMNKLTTSYSMYFNKSNDRTGSLFEGRFKARHIDTDEYLKYLFSYIHLNPIKLIQSDWKDVGIRDLTEAYDFAAKYQFSSFNSYIEEYTSPLITKDRFPDYFSTQAQYKEELLFWLDFAKGSPLHPYK